jgi:hypothetical protein
MINREDLVITLESADQEVVDTEAEAEFYTIDYGDRILVQGWKESGDDSWAVNHSDWEGINDAMHGYPTMDAIITAVLRLIDFMEEGPPVPPGLVHMGWFAECERCGEVYNPDGLDDLIHLRRMDEVECGGIPSALNEMFTKEST